MELKQLTYFVEIIRSGSLTQAAKKLAVTQPALSQAVQNLERGVGYMLVERGPRGLSLTPKGKIFLRYAVEVLDAADNLMEAAKGAEEVEKLRIYSGQTVATWVLPGIFSQLKKEYSDLFIEIREGDDQFVKKSLLSGEADLAITTEQIENEDVISEFLCEDTIGPAIATEHPLAQKLKITLSEILKEKFILYHAESAMQKIMDKLLTEARISDSIGRVMEVRSLAGMVKNIEAGLGVGFVSSLVKSEKLRMVGPQQLTYKRKFFLAVRNKREVRFKKISRSILEIGQKI
ncbi:MAG: LysR family transcriptional regulator [Leptospirales bacterium]